MDVQLLFLGVHHARGAHQMIPDEIHVGPLYGVRKWQLAVYSETDVGLSALSSSYSWSPGWNQTYITTHGYFGTFGSGFYSVTSPWRIRFLVAGSRIRAVGIVENHGIVMEHAHGYRSEWARPVALGFQGNLDPMDQRRFATWCRMYGIEYLGHTRSFGWWGKLARTYRQYQRGKRAAAVVPVKRGALSTHSGTGPGGGGQSILPIVGFSLFVVAMTLFMMFFDRVFPR